MLKSDVLDLNNGANNAASKLCELAVQRCPSLHPFQSGRSELTCHSMTNTEVEEVDVVNGQVTGNSRVIIPKIM
jgi:hypothetical protein